MAKISALQAVAASPAFMGRRDCGGSGAARGGAQDSLQLQHDCAFRDSWSGHTSSAGILGDPLPCCPTALVGTSLVLVDRDREPSNQHAVGAARSCAPPAL